MSEKMRHARKNATRIAVVLLSVMAIILGITTPSWSDTTGSLSLPSTTFYGLDFSADIYITTLSASLGIGTTNTTKMDYTIPTPTSVINLGKINPYTVGSSLTLNPQVQFLTPPTFTVSDSIAYTSGLNVSGFGQTIYNYTPDNQSYQGITINTQGTGSISASASGVTGAGSGSQTLSQTSISDTLWSIQANLITLARNIPPPVGTAATVIDAAGFYFSPKAGIKVDGTYQLGVQSSLNPLTVALSGTDLSGAPRNAAGTHTLSISDPLTLSLAAKALYQYEGEFYISYGDRQTLGPFDWDILGPYKLGSTSGGSWDPTNVTGGTASAQVALGGFAVTVNYEIPSSWDNPYGSRMNLEGTQSNYIPLDNAGSIEILGTLNSYNPGTLNNHNTINNAGSLTIDVGGKLNNNAEGILNNNYGSGLANNGTLNNNNGSILNNNYGSYLNNYGTLNNNSGGILNNNIGGTLNNINIIQNNGTLNNYGTLTNSAGLYGVYAMLTTGGTLNNYGKLDLKSDGEMDIYGTVNNIFGGSLYNSGTLKNYNTLNNSGSLINSGVYGALLNHYILNNYSYGYLSNFATIDNIGGTLNNYGFMLNNAGGILKNSGFGTLNNYSRLVNDSGAQLLNIENSTLNNNYYLFNRGYLENNGLYWQTGGALNNNAGATLDNSGGTLSNYAGRTLNNYGLLYNQLLSTINNYSSGLLNNYHVLYNSGAIENSGTLTNYADGSLVNKHSGILKNNATGTLNNYGYLVINEGSRLDNYGLLKNKTGGMLSNLYGTLNNKSGGTLQNEYELYNGATLDNSGTLANSGTVTNVATFMGTGTYNQTAGYTVNSGYMSQASVTIDGGGFCLKSGGSLLVQTPLQIGKSGTASFIQEGGTTSVNGAIALGAYSSGSGTYTLQDGSVNTASIYIGSQGTGSFIQTGDSSQTGGSVTVTNALNIGTYTGSGAYTMDKGTLTAKDLTVGSTGSGSVTGTLAITSAAAQVSVSGNLTINERGQFNAAPGVTINMTGANFYDYKPNDDLSNLRLFFSNVTASDILGFAGTLTLGTLELTGGTELEHIALDLENLLTTSSSMTLYVGNLILGDYCTLDLNGLNLYFLNETLGTGVTFLDGLPQQGVVPLPASVWLLLSGLAGLGLLERRRKGKNS